MKTVLFIDKTEEGLWSSFRKYDYLLDEYRGAGAFDVCFWNREGNSVDTAIPDLASTLGAETKWQAVIVTDLREGATFLRDDVHFDNPFDFLDSYDAQPGDGFSESSHSLVRLSQMLGGLPEKSFVEWKEHGHAGLQLNDVGVSYSAEDQRYDLMERYRLGVTAPQRVICVTPRDVDPEFDAARMREFDLAASERLDRRRALEAEREAALERGDFASESFELLEEQLRCYERDDNAAKLGFWERNDYPPIARFVVIDRIAPSVVTEAGSQLAEAAAATKRFDEREPSGPRSYWFDFWMCVLSLMVSTVAPGDLRAYDVYRMSIDVDEEELGASFGRRRAQWVDARRQIKEHVDKDQSRLRPSEYLRADMPDTQVTIPVTFDLVNRDELYTDPSVVGFVKDVPKRDLSVWAEQSHVVLEQFRELLRAPRRALHVAAERFRSQKPIPYEELEYCILNAAENDSLVGEVQGIERRLANGAGTEPFSYEASESEFNDADAAVRNEIEKRVSRRQALAILGIAIIALLFGLVPYVGGMMGGVGLSTSAAVVAAACCLIMVAVFLVTLWRMRQKVRGAYVAHNDAMRHVVGEFISRGSVYERRISDFATFRKKWSVVERQRNLDAPTRETERLGRCAALLKTRIHDIDEVARSCDIELDVSGYAVDISWDQLNDLLDDDSFYNIRDIAPSAKRYDGFESGSFVDVPYEFISGLALEPMKLA